MYIYEFLPRKTGEAPKYVLTKEEADALYLQIARTPTYERTHYPRATRFSRVSTATAEKLVSGKRLFYVIQTTDRATQKMTLTVTGTNLSIRNDIEEFLQNLRPYMYGGQSWRGLFVASTVAEARALMKEKLCSDKGVDLCLSKWYN